MIPDPKNPYPDKETIIIDILSRTPRLTVKELYSQFSRKSQKKLTLQGFYRLLSELQKRRVIVKDGKLLSIDAGWVHAVLNFSEQLRSTYLQANPTTANILVQEGESTTFEFPTVIDMDNYWCHALIITTHYYGEHKHKDPHVYNYNDHCWYQVIRSSSERALGDTYADMGLKWYLVSGSTSYIDGLVSSMVEPKGLHYAQNTKVDFPKNYYVVVIGDYIFETALPKYIFEMMESVYERVVTITDPALQSIEGLVHLPAKTTLTISKNARHAEKVRSKIKKCF